MGSKRDEKIALIQGGLGAEKEVSWFSARAVARVFDELGMAYQVIESDADLVNKLVQAKPSGAFLAVHGKYAEDGILQGILEYLGIPYTGSGLLASSICMDKCFFKNYISQYKIPTPAYQVLNVHNQKLEEIKFQIPFPLLVKPSREGSTLGISICRTEEEFLPALKKALQYDKKILLEAYIEGTEIAISYLDGQILTPIEIVPKSGFYDYKSKYTKGETEYILPARLDERVREECKKYMMQSLQILDIRAYCRADFIIEKNKGPFMIEMNTLPGLTSQSLLPQSALHDGISFKELVQKILKLARLDYKGIKHEKWVRV